MNRFTTGHATAYPWCSLTVLREVVDERLHLGVCQAVVRKPILSHEDGLLEGLNVGRGGQSLEKDLEAVAVQSVFVEAHGGHLFCLVSLRRLQSRVRFDEEELAEGVDVFVEFADGFECLEVDVVCVDRLVLSKRPDSLHFKL